MSLFTDILQRLTGSDQDSAVRQSRELAEGLLDFLQDQRTGGIEEMIDRFRRHGLGDVLSSWIGAGPNRPISPEQVTETLGRPQVEALSQRAGLPPDQGAKVLSQYLPEFIDKLTPEGKAPEKSQISTLGKIILGSLGAAAAAGIAAKVLRKEEDEKPSAAKTPSPSVSVAVGGASESAAARAGTTIYTVVSGDTLSKIAKHYYGDANQWPRIFEANRDTLKNPDRIFPGQKLRIP
jgi:uncharacterized protein YidB (DUF937 family)